MASVSESAARVARPALFQAKHLMWMVYGLLVLLVFAFREATLLDASSPLHHRDARAAWLMVVHGVPGAVALFVAPFQFSNRLRQRYLQLHRLLGRVYVVCVFVSAPLGIAVAHVMTVPTVFSASLIQSFGWVATTATALYCVRTGRIQQHREWMMRSYPFAMVFIVNRALFFVPAIARGGELARAETVWSGIAVACFLPSFVIAWQALVAGKSKSIARS